MLVFVKTDCPISNRYAPELIRLKARFDAAGVGFRLVYPDPRESPEQVRAHADEYGLSAIPTLRDPGYALVDRAGVKITPEAAVLADGEVVYRGRIDDRWESFGRFRAEATTHDLVDAVTAVTQGRAPQVRQTKAIGCYIPRH